MPTTPEQKVKKEVLKYLRAQGHGCYPHKTGATWDAKLGIYRSMSADTGTVGESDLLVFDKNNPTQPIWVELKSATGKLRPDQVLFKKLVEEWGHTFVVVRGKEDCKKMGL